MEPRHGAESRPFLWPAVTLRYSPLSWLHKHCQWHARVWIASGAGQHSELPVASLACPSHGCAARLIT